MIRLHEDDEDELPCVTRVTVKPKKKKSSSTTPKDVLDQPTSTKTSCDEQQHTIFRSRETGQRITEEEWLQQQQKHRRGPQKDNKKPRLAEAELPHGGGIVQRQMIDVAEQHAQEILESGFHRAEIQTSLDEELRKQQRAEDPMKEFLTKAENQKPSEHAPLASRFISPPNRFGIKAGSKWDGRVRGTGFEEKYLEALRALDKEPQTISDDEE